MTLEADDLKNKFVTGAVPKEADFRGLIDLANKSLIKLGIDQELPKKLSGIDNQSERLGLKVSKGLKLNEAKQLEVNIKPNSGFKVTPKDGLELVVAKNSGLKVNQDGLLINKGDGLKLDEEKKLAVNANKGLIADADGVRLKLASDSGLEIEENTDELGIKVNSEYLTTSGGGITLSEQGKALLEQTGNPAFIDALTEAQKDAAETCAIKTTHTRFPQIITTKTSNKLDWKKDIKNNFKTITNANINFFIPVVNTMLQLFCNDKMKGEALNHEHELKTFNINGGLVSIDYYISYKNSNKDPRMNNLFNSLSRSFKNSIEWGVDVYEISPLSSLNKIKEIINGQSDVFKKNDVFEKKSSHKESYLGENHHSLELNLSKPLEQGHVYILKAWIHSITKGGSRQGELRIEKISLETPSNF